MKIRISGRTYHSVRTTLNGSTFDTPKRRESITIDVTKIPDNFLKLEELKIIKIEKIN